jgi:hypothetical protein
MADTNTNILRSPVSAISAAPSKGETMRPIEVTLESTPYTDPIRSSGAAWVIKAATDETMPPSAVPVAACKATNCQGCVTNTINA